MRDTHGVSVEKRQHPRSTCSLPATADGPRGPCTNISLSGAFLEGIQLSMGASTRVTLTAPGVGEVVLEAQVKRHSSSPRGMGVEFTRLDPQKVALLQQLVARFG